MKIDAHQHFWVYNEKEYRWISEQMTILKKDHLPGDLAIELQHSGFEGSIAIQSRQTLEETRWLLKLAGIFDFIRGVVGWVDLCSADVHSQLAEFASFQKLVGVRHVIHDEPDDEFMLRKNFINGIRCLKEFELAYDILIFPRHLKNTIRFVKQFPDQTFILDHIAKPEIKRKMFSPWAEDIRQLALLPNVFCKLSGMVTEADIVHWTETDFKKYLDIVVEAFGIPRLMIGSDWPVCRLGGSYSMIMDIVLNYFSDFPESDQKLIFGLNAARAYKLQ